MRVLAMSASSVSESCVSVASSTSAEAVQRGLEPVLARAVDGAQAEQGVEVAR